MMTKTRQVELDPMDLNLTEEIDRRARQRFRISAPLLVRIGDREVPAYTRDLSDQGVYFFLSVSDSELIDHEFEFVVELPPEITLSSFCRVCCHGRSLRKEDNRDHLTGIAAEILNYSILRNQPASRLSPA